MSRLHLTDTVFTIVEKMCEGNPGAMQVCMELLNNDPAYLLLCDTLELYGEELYMLWNDCCGRDLPKMKKVLDAVRTGKISEATVHEHLKGGYGKPFEEIED